MPLIEKWWNALNLPLQVFYVIGVLAAFALLAQTLLAMFLGDLDADAGHGGGDAGPFSIRTLSAFFFGFGWSGVVALNAGLGVPGAVAVAFVVGTGFLVVLYLLVRLLVSARHSGTLDYRNAVGQTATVYVAVPGARGGEGQVEVLVQGRLQMVHAMTAHDQSLPPRSRVRVTGLVDGTTLEVEAL
ncbi:MAG TPA: hypothetical protein VMN36_17165 [Verrucomicrobiales bacterium]|nr:hypothetical protein [Verrucomicrobiales bacterium]